MLQNLLQFRLSHRRNGVWLGAESNRRHEDFQSSALPTELPSRIALPLSRCIERRVLIKAENAQPSTPSCSGDLSAFTERRPYHCRASILSELYGSRSRKPACCFFAAGGSACPTKSPRAKRIHLVGRRSAESGKSFGSTETRPTREVLPEAALQINSPLEQR